MMTDTPFSTLTFEGSIFLTLAQVAKLIGVSETTVRKMSREGRFPTPVKIDTRTRWRAKEVLDWVEQLPRAKSC